MANDHTGDAVDLVQLPNRHVRVASWNRKNRMLDEAPAGKAKNEDE